MTAVIAPTPDADDAYFCCVAKLTPRVRVRKQLRALNTAVTVSCDYGVRATRRRAPLSRSAAAALAASGSCLTTRPFVPG